MRRPRPAIRPLRLLLALVALLTAGTLPAHAQESPPPGGGTPTADPWVVIDRGDGTTPRRRPWSEFASSLDARAVPIVMPDGSTRAITGLTVRALLERFNVPLSSFSQFTVVDPSGTELQVSRVQARLPATYTAVLFLDEQDGLLKIVRQATENDPRPAELARATGDSLVLTLQKGASLTPSAYEANVGERITFTLTPPPGVSSDQLEFSWDFNDNSRAVRTTETVMSHAFREVGAFNVIVNVYVDGELWTDVSPFVEVSISEPAQERAQRRNRDARGAGTRRRDPEAGSGDPDPGVGDSGLLDGSGSGPIGGAGPGYTPDVAATPPAVTPPPTPEQPEPQPRRRAAQPAEPEGETVTGYLLASADGQPLPAGGAQRDDRQPLVSEAASTPLEIPALAWVLTGLAALVLLGWALESRTTLPYFRP